LFPKKEYLRELVKIWEEEKLLLVEKSRQMLMTWLWCALNLHEAQFNEGKYNFFQSKKEDDAAALIDRAKFIFHHQPDFLKQSFDETFCKIKFPKSNSQIIGIPQGGDQIRMHTASRIFGDEMGFQPEAEDSFTAARPCIEGGGAFNGVSSANPGYFQGLCEEEGEWIEIRKGLKKKYTPSGFCIVRLHYTADPVKATPEWKIEAKKGLSDAQWRKEYEIDYTALGGMKVYPELIPEVTKEILVNPFEIPAHWRRYVGLDPGVRNPTSCHFYAVDEKGNVYCYWELYEKEIHYKDLARILKEHEDFLKIKRSIFIDPISATQVHHTKFGIKSFKDLLEQEGIFTFPGNRNRLDGAEKIREYIIDRKLKIFKTCPKLMWELENLRYAEWTGNIYLKNPREEIVPRDDHAWSDLRYFLMSNPASTKKPIIGLEAKIKKQLKEKRGAIGELYRVDEIEVIRPPTGWREKQEQKEKGSSGASDYRV